MRSRFDSLPPGQWGECANCDRRIVYIEDNDVWVHASSQGRVIFGCRAYALALEQDGSSYGPELVATPQQNANAR